MGDHMNDINNPVLIEERPVPGVALLRLHRPEALNALNLVLRHALAAAFTRLDADDTVRVVVLAGSARAFCAGADLREYLDAGSQEVAARDMGRLWDAVADCRKPVIAAVRGHALGGGCELAMHADLIIAADNASFGQPEVLLGLMPGGGATQRLTRAVGKFVAMKLLLTGERIDGRAAAAMGLASEAVADAEVEPRALALATRLAGGARQAQRAIKEAVIASMNTSLAQGLALERKAFQLLFETDDKHEGIAARLEKREARFR